MGISGLFAQIGHGQRISLAKLSAEYYAANNRPFRLAIDISIWLFQIQSGKGGSNPALRTFYYRLLRLLSLNIHPLFVFDGPNKPQFKRNKKVGGPGIKVASVPEFLAKQLLKHFGFPLHVAPGEAEAECALLQREGIVDAVLSEDVDTLMFGSGVTLRNWTAENSTKTPTHVDVHRADDTKTRSGMDREGMILVALMSGGDYLPEGIPGCGPKVACDAGRAGFGKDLCGLGKKDAAGLQAWKERLRHEIRTNESKLFKRRNPSLVIPDDFPDYKVLGFYTNPCVSTPEKVARLRQELRWDLPMDFAELRSFAGDAFDWRCIGGAKKFIKNLAPALLMRELRLTGSDGEHLELEEQEEKEHQMILAIHGKRNHSTTDEELEYRISFVPEKLVPIDLSIEDEDDDFLAAGGVTEDVSDAESESMQLLSSTQGGEEVDAPSSPKKRNFKPYDPAQPEKLWILRPFLQVGCPLLVEDYESTSKDPKEFLKQRRQARAVGKLNANIHGAKPKAKKSKAKETDMPANTMLNYARATKPGTAIPAKQLSDGGQSKLSSQSVVHEVLNDREFTAVATFKMPATQVPAEFVRPSSSQTRGPGKAEVLDLATKNSKWTHNPTPITSDVRRPFVASARVPEQVNVSSNIASQTTRTEEQQTPKRKTKKRPPPDCSSPALSQRTISSYYSPSPRKPKDAVMGHVPVVIDLLSSPFFSIDAEERGRPLTSVPPNTRSQLAHLSASPPPTGPEYSPGKLPDTVTKRRKKGALKRWQTEPIFGSGDANDLFVSPGPRVDPAVLGRTDYHVAATVNYARLPGVASPKASDDLVSPSSFIRLRYSSEGHEGGFLREEEEDADVTPKALRMSNQERTSAPGFGLVVAKDGPDQLAIPLEMGDELFDDPFPRPSITASKHVTSKPSRTASSSRRPPTQQISSSHPLRKSPRQQALKKRIHLRESLEGSWKVMDAEAIDMTGDGSGWKSSGGKARLDGWRKSGVEVLDLTGA